MCFTIYRSQSTLARVPWAILSNPSPSASATLFPQSRLFALLSALDSKQVWWVPLSWKDNCKKQLQILSITLQALVLVHLKSKPWHYIGLHFSSANQLWICMFSGNDTSKHLWHKSNQCSSKSSQVSIKSHLYRVEIWAAIWHTLVITLERHRAYKVETATIFTSSNKTTQYDSAIWGHFLRQCSHNNIHTMLGNCVGWTRRQ